MTPHDPDNQPQGFVKELDPEALDLPSVIPAEWLEQMRGGQVPEEFLAKLRDTAQTLKK